MPSFWSDFFYSNWHFDKDNRIPWQNQIFFGNILKLSEHYLNANWNIIFRNFSSSLRCNCAQVRLTPIYKFVVLKCIISDLKWCTKNSSAQFWHQKKRCETVQSRQLAPFWNPPILCVDSVLAQTIPFSPCADVVNGLQIDSRAPEWGPQFYWYFQMTHYWSRSSAPCHATTGLPSPASIWPDGFGTRFSPRSNSKCKKFD